jgi:hypothetical protein
VNSSVGAEQRPEYIDDDTVTLSRRRDRWPATTPVRERLRIRQTATQLDDLAVGTAIDQTIGAPEGSPYDRDQSGMSGARA